MSTLESSQQMFVVSLWDHYDVVRDAARRLAQLGNALHITEWAEEEYIVELIMGMGDIGNGVFLIDSTEAGTTRSSGLVRIQFEWCEAEKRIEPSFLFLLAPWLDI